MGLRINYNKVYRYLKNKYVIYSFISSLFLMLISYFVNNSPLFTGESMLQYYGLQKVCEKIGIHKTVSYGDAVYYNMSYDKMLVPSIDRADTIGNNCISDRGKLLKFLRLLESSNKYKYIIVDIIFDKSERSEYDDELYTQIKKMRNIIIADHLEVDHTWPDFQESKKSGLVTYFATTVSTNFGRMEYLIGDKESLPLAVYENITPKGSMKRYGIGRLSLYTMNGKLCQNSCFLTFDNTFVKPIKTEKKLDFYVHSNKFINLGQFIDDPTSDEDELKELIGINTDNKYVVIGDFVGDVHDTYIGAIPGSVIMMRALATLEENGNIVKFAHVMLWLFVFFLINLSILYNRPISKHIPIIKNIPYKLFHFCFSLITFTSILIVVSTIEYICEYQTYSLVVPILYFSILKLYVQYKNQ